MHLSLATDDCHCRADSICRIINTVRQGAITVALTSVGEPLSVVRVVEPVVATKLEQETAAESNESSFAIVHIVLCHKINIGNTDTRCNDTKCCGQSPRES